MLKGTHNVLAHLVAVPPYAVGIIVPEKESSVIPDNLPLALGHCVHPLFAVPKVTKIAQKKSQKYPIVAKIFQK